MTTRITLTKIIQKLNKNGDWYTDKSIFQFQREYQIFRDINIERHHTHADSWRSQFGPLGGAVCSIYQTRRASSLWKDFSCKTFTRSLSLSHMHALTFGFVQPFTPRLNVCNMYRTCSAFINQTCNKCYSSVSWKVIQWMYQIHSWVSNWNTQVNVLLWIIHLFSVWETKLYKWQL